MNANRTKLQLSDTKKCLNHVFPLEQPKNYQDGKSFAQELQHGPPTWKHMFENAWNGIANWQTKRRSNCIRFSARVWTITEGKRKTWKKKKGEVSEVCSHIVLKCLYLARIGRPDILWSVNKLTRSVTRWTQACDRRLPRLISCIHHTSQYRQYCHVGNAAQHCRLGLFQDSDFAGDLEDSKSTSGGVLCIFGSRTFVPISRMCTKQNFSISQIHKIKDHFAGRLFTYGWFTRAGLVGFGHIRAEDDSRNTKTNPS